MSTLTSIISLSFDDTSSSSYSYASVIRRLLLIVMALEADALELRRASLALTLLYLALNDIVSEVHHDTFENVFAHRIQNHEQSESILDTYVMNENNGTIISDILHMDLDRGKEEHDYIYCEQQHALFGSLINNRKSDVEKYNKVNREAQQANALLTNELARFKEKEKHFAKETTIESEYRKKIKILNDKIPNHKSQACQNDKTFSRENRKLDEYVQPLLERKNELEKKNKEFLKQINDLDNRLRKAG
nr:hypothetical protein [Tanacetum cinerariifolium]